MEPPTEPDIWYYDEREWDLNKNLVWKRRNMDGTERKVTPFLTLSREGKKKRIVAMVKAQKAEKEEEEAKEREQEKQQKKAKQREKDTERKRKKRAVKKRRTGSGQGCFGRFGATEGSGAIHCCC